MSKTSKLHATLTKLARLGAEQKYPEHLSYEFASSLCEAYSLESPSSWIDDDPELHLQTTADEFRSRYLRQEILSKYDSHNLSIDTEEVAWEKFRAAELQCASTNRRLYGSYARDFISRTGEAVIHTARRKIAAVLGDFRWSDVILGCRFSGGASTTLSRRHGHAAFKYSTPQECTPGVLPLVNEFRSLSTLDIPAVSGVVLSNKATTVPKNSKTDRCIAIEPGWNMFFQLGVGAVIRSRLCRWNINLNDQSINQGLALLGSLNDDLATIDLSAASDTISYSLVELLLPHDWFLALDRLRCPSGVLPDGTVIHYEKFSSMGNGFTFELESLIFAALTRAVCELNCVDASKVSVYGDDIIAPVDISNQLSEVFEYVGFTTNAKKTFTSGPFRESCGKHYYRGFDVTPFYIRSPIRNPYELTSILNRLFIWGTVDGVWDPRALAVYERYRALLPREWRVNVLSADITDGALVGFITTSPFSVWRNGMRRDCVVKLRTRASELPGYGYLVSWLAQKSDDSYLTYSEGIASSGCKLRLPVKGYEAKVQISSNVFLPYRR